MWDGKFALRGVGGGVIIRSLCYHNVIIAHEWLVENLAGK